MIKQAVIFCGGRGTRLKQISKKVPKPMVDICGKPFLEHLIIQLKKNGIKSLILLTGYKNKIIENYFLDGKKLNLKITYSYLPASAQTGTRLYKVKDKLNSKFLLLYSDNYSSINIHKLNDELEKSKKKMIICLSKKKKGNTNLNHDKTISYSLKRNIKNKYVEIGYMILKKEILNHLTRKDNEFSNFIYKLSKKKLILGKIQNNGYTSIGDIRRLNLTRKLFQENNFILIDRDGVLNLKHKKDRYITHERKLIINKFICNKLPKNGKYICITNQAGLSTKQLTITNLKKINFKLKSYLKQKGIKLEKFYISNHHFNSNSYYRKPNPGLFLKAAKEYNFILDKTFYVGDDKRDVEAAYNANTFIIYVGKDNFSKVERNKYKFTILNKSIKQIYEEKKKYSF